jgi:hypothetical protein
MNLRDAYRQAKSDPTNTARIANAGPGEFAIVIQFPYIHRCIICHGTGWVADADPENGPEFDTIYPCDCPVGEAAALAAESEQPIAY